MCKEEIVVKFEALSRHLSGGTEKKHQKPHSGYPVSKQRFESETYRTQSRSLAVIRRLCSTLGTLAVRAVHAVVTLNKLTKFCHRDKKLHGFHPTRALILSSHCHILSPILFLRWSLRKILHNRFRVLAC